MVSWPKCWLFELAVVFLSLFAACNARGQDEPAATLTIKEIWQKATDRQNAIKSIRVEYDMEWKKLADVPGVSGGVSFGRSPVVFAIEGQKRYSKTKRKYRVDDKELSADEVCIFDGKNSFHYFMGQLSYFDEKIPCSEDSEFYCHIMLQMPYLDKDKVSLDNSWFYPHCIRSAPNSKYTVLKVLEKVDDAWCHVIEYPKRDKIWIDPKIGCAIRKRVRQSDTPKGEVYDLATFEMSQYKEVSSGLWLPFKCVRHDYAGPQATKESQGKEYAQLLIDVHNVRMKLTDEDFDLNVPPGTMVNVVKTNHVFRIEGNKQQLLAEVTRQAQVLLGPNRGSPIWLVMSSVLFGLGVMLILVWRSWFRKPPEGEQRK